MFAMKPFITKVTRLLLAPWRRAKQLRYSDAESEKTARIELPNEAFLPVVAASVADGHTAIIAVKGYSMRPFLEHLRDKVKLERCSAEDLKVGDAVLAEISPGHFVLHRIIELEADAVTLMGDGNIRGTEHCSVSEVRARVREYIRPGGHVVEASDPALCRKIRWWRRLLPIRRYLLFIYKATI